jgi:hypothetical protein
MPRVSLPPLQLESSSKLHRSTPRGDAAPQRKFGTSCAWPATHSACTSPRCSATSSWAESLPGHELDPSFLPHAQALQRLAAGQLDAVLTTQRLRHRDRRQGLIEHPIGDLVLAAVVPQKHPMWDLRREQLGELLAGDWTHWDQLGGPNNSIETLALPDDDPVWSCAMESLFAGKKLAPHVQRCTNEDVLQIILTRKPMAIGLLPLGTFRSDLDLRVLSINGTQPSPHMVRSGKYPLRVRCALVVRRDAQLPVLRFVSYATGNEARASLATLLTPAH